MESKKCVFPILKITINSATWQQAISKRYKEGKKRQREDKSGQKSFSALEKDNGGERER